FAPWPATRRSAQSVSARHHRYKRRPSLDPPAGPTRTQQMPRSRRTVMNYNRFFGGFCRIGRGQGQIATSAPIAPPLPVSHAGAIEAERSLLARDDNGFIGSAGNV